MDNSQNSKRSNLIYIQLIKKLDWPPNSKGVEVVSQDSNNYANVLTFLFHIFVFLEGDWSGGSRGYREVWGRVYFSDAILVPPVR